MKDDLLQEIELDLGSPLRRSGRWVFWRCPFHADNNPSLGVTADNARWYCFSCSRGGDVRAWTREYRRERIPAPSGTQQSIYPMAAPKDYSSPPAKDWQIRAWNFLTDCQATLWRPVAQKARWGLYGRGLNGDTFTPAWIGYHPGDRFEPLDQWGLQPRSEKEKAVYLPAGLVIPWIIEDVVWKINIRRLGQQTPKYLQVKGSRPGLFGAHNLAGKSELQRKREPKFWIWKILKKRGSSSVWSFPYLHCLILLVLDRFIRSREPATLRFSGAQGHRYFRYQLLPHPRSSCIQSPV